MNHNKSQMHLDNVYALVASVLPNDKQIEQVYAVLDHLTGLMEGNPATDPNYEYLTTDETMLIVLHM